METNLDEELKMAEIRKIEQMIAESFATVEKMHPSCGIISQANWEVLSAASIF